MTIAELMKKYSLNHRHALIQCHYILKFSKDVFLRSLAQSRLFTLNAWKNINLLTKHLEQIQETQTNRFVQGILEKIIEEEGNER